MIMTPLPSIKVHVKVMPTFGLPIRPFLCVRISDILFRHININVSVSVRMVCVTKISLLPKLINCMAKKLVIVCSAMSLARLVKARSQIQNHIYTSVRLMYSQ